MAVIVVAPKAASWVVEMVSLSGMLWAAPLDVMSDTKLAVPWEYRSVV